MTHLYLPILSSAAVIGSLVLRNRRTGKSAWMICGTGIANCFVRIGCAIEAAFLSVELAGRKFFELYRENKAAQGL